MFSRSKKVIRDFPCSGHILTDCRRPDRTLRKVHTTARYNFSATWISRARTLIHFEVKAPRGKYQSNLLNSRRGLVAAQDNIEAGVKRVHRIKKQSYSLNVTIYP